MPWVVIMEAKILVRTPKGQASGTKDKIKRVFGTKKNTEVFTNKETGDDEILLIVNDTPRKVMKVMTRAYAYPKLAQEVMNHKLAKGTMMKKVGKEKYKIVYDLIKDGTTVDVIKYDDYLEELKNKRGVFQKIKDRLGL